MKNRAAAVLVAVVQIAGLVAIVYGLADVYRPLGKIAGGAVALVAGILAERSARRPLPKAD